MKKNNFKIHFFRMSLLLSLLFSFENLLAVGLGLDPKRIIFEDRDRNHEVFIFNQGKSTKDVKIYFENYSMNSEGKQIASDGKDSDTISENMIRYSPRRISVPPGETQTVRLMLRKPKGLAAGEYRSYMSFEEIPNPEKGLDVEKIAIKKGVINTQIIAKIKLSIPIIVRTRDLYADVSISDLKINKKNEEKSLELVLNRAGNKSVYGSLVVHHVSQSSDKTLLAMLNGVAVYTSADKRIVNIPLKGFSSIKNKKGFLEVTYTDKEQQEGELLASNKLLLE